MIINKKFNVSEYFSKSDASRILIPKEIHNHDTSPNETIEKSKQLEVVTWFLFGNLNKYIYIFKTKYV